MAKLRNRRAGARKSKGNFHSRKRQARRTPSAGEQLLVRANSLHQRGKANEAGAIYVEILNADPDNPDALHRFGVLHTDVGRPEQAVELIGEALRQQPGNAGIRCDLGNALQSMGRHEEALECYRVVLEAEPRNLTALTNLGLVSQILGRAREARAALTAALKIAPADATLNFNFGTVLQGQGRLDEAEAAYRRALTINPKMLAAQVNIGNINLDREHFTEAAAAFERAIALDPGLAIAHANLGSALDALERVEEASMATRRALEIDPDNVIALGNLGQAMQEDEQPVEAVKTFQRLLKVEPGHVNTLAYLAIALQEAGQREEAAAIFDFKTLLAIRPISRIEGYDNIAKFNAALKQYILNHPTLVWERPAKSTNNGSQTLELLTGDDPVAIALRRMIEDNLTEYISSRLMKAGSSYRGRAPQNWRLTSWAVVLKSGGHQSPHNHPMGVVSGVYYLNIPESVGRDDDGLAGCLRLGQSNLRIKGKRDQAGFLTETIAPREGVMVLFPSYFWHHTIPFESKDYRISVAVDAIPTQ